MLNLLFLCDIMNKIFFKGALSMENNYQNPNQPIYEAAPAYQPIVEEPKKKNGVFGIIALITGILSIFCCFYGANVPLIAVTIVMAILDRKKNEKMSAMAVIGLVGAIIGILSLVSFFVLLFIGAIGSAASTTTYGYY